MPAERSFPTLDVTTEKKHADMVGRTLTLLLVAPVTVNIPPADSWVQSKEVAAVLLETRS